MKAVLLFLTLLVSVNHAQSADETLFREKCSSCHALPEPQSLNGRQWQAVLQTMQKRMSEAGKPPLSDAEFKKVLCYVSENTAAGCAPAK